MPRYSVVPGAPVAIVAATAKTILQLRGVTTTDAYVCKFRVSFDETVATEGPVRVRLLYQSTDGTMTAATEVPSDPGSVAAKVTAFHTATAEPTAGAVVEDLYVPAYNGVYESQEVPLPDLGSMYHLEASTSSRIGLELTAEDNCNALAELWWWEV